MSILVSNCGSSSLKCRLFDRDESVLAWGRVEALGGEGEPEAFWGSGTHEKRRTLPGANHARAFEALGDGLVELAFGDASRGSAIEAVGHRVVHGGERFREAVAIDEGVEAEIEALAPLAPLHNPLCLAGIRAARHKYPHALHVAVFDTAFHQSLPEAAYLYALPYDAYTRDGVRRYGFHGSSHRAVSERAIAWLGRGDAGTRVVSCHLGAGCSTAAVRDGRSVDTSMGMTPLEGLVMSTRSGDVDPGALAYLGERRGLDARGVERLLLRESGLLGLSGHSGDMKRLLDGAEAGDEGAERALRVFAHRVRRYIGAHLAVLGGADALVFTGGAGENSPALRARILEGLEELGFELDLAANARCAGSEGTISTPEAPIAVYVIGSNEEREIARETRALLDARA